VAHDPVTRSLLVKPAKGAGYAGLLRRRGHEKLTQAEETGSWAAPPTVYAHGVGRGVPVRDGWMRFKPSPAVYRQLTSTADLAATVVVDGETATS
jgi:hypothetical protein